MRGGVRRSLSFFALIFFVFLCFTSLVLPSPTMDAAAPVMIKAVLFDMGGVFADDMFGPMLAYITKKANLTTEEADQLKKAAKDIWNVIKITPGPTEDYFFEEMQKRVPKSKNIAISELKDVTRDGLLGHYENIAIAERIRRAEKRKIGILSNHMEEWFSEIMVRFGIKAVFRQHPSLVISSHQVKCAKPSLDIYAVAYQRIHELDTSIQRNEVVFIDDKEDNIVAARTFGFQGIVYNAKYQPASVLAAALVAHGVTEAAVPVFVTNS